MYKTTFEHEALDKLYADSPEELIEILEEYISSHDEIITSLNNAFEEGPKELRSKVHFHSSVFNYVGFPQLTTDCVDFEERCKTMDKAALSPYFDNLISCINETAGYLKKEMELLELKIASKNAMI